MLLVVRSESDNGSRLAVGDARPDAEVVMNAAELVAAMRRLKCWSGLSYRQLESRAAACGLVLPRSTLTNALHRETLPRADLLATFVQACGCREAEAARWVAARQRLAVAAAGGPDVTSRRTAHRWLAAALVGVVVVAVLVTAVVTAWLAAF